MSIDSTTGSFNWTPALGDGPSQRTVTITLSAGGTGEPQTSTLAADSFESAPVDTPVASLEGWSGSGKVTNDPAGPAGYQGTLPLPEAAHTKTLQVTGLATREAAGESLVTTDMMLRPSLYATVASISLAPGAQSAFAFMKNGNLQVYHSVPDGAGYKQVWTEVELANPVAEGDWVRFGMVTDYASSARPNPLFQVLVNGVTMTHALALAEPDLDCATAGGTWFIAASGQTVGNGGSANHSALEVKGHTILDDLVCTSTTTPDQSSDSKTFTITVTPAEQNRAPVAQGQNVTTAEDTAVQITLAATDADGDPLIYSITTQPAPKSRGCGT
jgi:hypothetical protein